MKTFSKYDLPDTITHNNQVYKLDQGRTHLHNSHKLSTKNQRGCVLVKVLPRNLRGKLDLRHKPYQPNEWIFYCMEAAKTHKAYEEYLNDLYGDAITSYVEANEQLGHLIATRNNKLFGGVPNLLIHYYNQKQLGTFVRKYGPIEFYAGFNDWFPQ